MTGWGRDVLFATRMLRRSPGASAVAALCLAVGLGANVLIFSLINAVLLRPLPVREPGGIARLEATAADGTRSLRISYPDFIDYRAPSEAMAGVVAYSLVPMTLTAGQASAPALGEVVSGDYFEVLGVRASLGRTLAGGDDDPAAPPAAVLGHELWTRRFASDPGVIGRAIQVNGDSFTVVGVVEPGYTGTLAGVNPDLWVSIGSTGAWRRAGWDTDREDAWLHVLARLASGVTLARARAHMRLRAGQLAIAYPDSHRDESVDLAPAELLHGARRAAAAGLFGVVAALVGLVLLAACANVANLQLVRAVARRREIAIRLALGATRWRLLRQLLTESLLLSLVGGAAGLVLAVWAGGWLAGFNPIPTVPLRLDLSPDGRVILFGVLAAIVTGVATGLAPALRASRPDLAPVLKEDSRGGSGGRQGSRLRDAFVVGQVAVSLLVLIAAGLLGRSLLRAGRLDPGFEVESTLAIDFDLSKLSSSPETLDRTWQRLLDHLRAMPGVGSASLADLAPLDLATRRMAVRPDPAGSPPEGVKVSAGEVGSGYFRTMGIPLVRGRECDRRDGRTTPGVAIVNETMARRFWPSSDAVGGGIRLVEGDAPIEVIGVARDAKYRTLGEQPEPHIYLCVEQRAPAALSLLVRAQGDPAALLVTLQRELPELDRSLQPFFPRTMSQHVGLALLPARLAGILSGVFGSVALLLAAVGLYGVVSHVVGQRTREIGIRMALGARAVDVARLIARQGMTLAALGTAAGLVLAAGLTRLLSGLLYGVSPLDAATFLGVPALLGLVALAACIGPARRASAIDPMVAMREE